MAQSKVTDYYSRRKHTSVFQSAKRRSSRPGKVTLDDSALGKCLPETDCYEPPEKVVPVPEPVACKTAAFGVNSSRANPITNAGVDLSLQLKSFNKSLSKPSKTESVGDILTRTVSRSVLGGRNKKTINFIDSQPCQEAVETKQKVSEKTPLKRQASTEPDRDGPPGRKRSKLNTNEAETKTFVDDVNRTPSRSKRRNTASARRRLEPETASGTQSVTKSAKHSCQSTQSQSNIGSLDPAEMRNKLVGCGKLADLQARLALVKGTAADIKKLRETATREEKVKAQKEIPTEKEPEKYVPVQVPAFERYRHLLQQGPSTLSLPFKYRSLEDTFRCSDTVVSMLHNRMETCTYSKLKHGVQEMTRKTFDLSHLKKIKTVYPSAYDMKWMKTLPQFKKENEKNDPYTLVLEADLAGIPTDPDRSNIEVGGTVSEPKTLMKTMLNPGSAAGSAAFEKFTPSMLIARRTLFHNGLVDIVKTHHLDYLSKLNPPIKVPSDKLNRWHPRFPLEQVPEIQPTDIPNPPKVTSYNTAKDVLNKARDMMVNPKVTRALELVAKNSELKAAVEAKRNAEAKQTKEEVPSSKPKTNKALKGVSQDLLNRIKAKEAHRSEVAMMRSPEQESRIGMLERLPELIRILRGFFLAEKKAALPLDVVSQKLMESYRSALARDEVEKHIALMVEILPEWLKKINIRKVWYIKMDRTKELSSLTDIVNKKLQEARR
ncbi:DNA replication factor Cdt1-like [Diadema antillarum]|uniref:DNA replication factor Cdt1-like n=1 Tax=Diadema antillarum TaxID=105358 RepID=UPI003A8C06A2